MIRRLTAVAVIVFSLCVTATGAQPAADDEGLAAMAYRVNAYITLHRRVEGPVPPLEASKNLDEVRRLMARVRAGIIDARRKQGQGYVFTEPATGVLRKRIGGTLTRDDLLAIEADLVEHTPAGMPQPRVNAALPQDAPFIPIPAHLFKLLPPLPVELRYVILDKALLLWDQHADLVVDIAPRLFDPAAYKSTSELH
jgi:hypothetical protein